MVGIPCTGLVSSLFLPVPDQELDFQCHMSWSFFVFNGLRWEVIIHFVDIGGIVYYQCLNFLFNKAFVSMSSYVDFPSLRLWKEWFLSWGTKLTQLIIKIKVHIVSWHFK